MPSRAPELSVLEVETKTKTMLQIATVLRCPSVVGGVVCHGTLNFSGSYHRDPAQHGKDKNYILYRHVCALCRFQADVRGKAYPDVRYVNTPEDNLCRVQPHDFSRPSQLPSQPAGLIPN